VSNSLHRAEYILDVIGAGATATTSTDWYNVWKNSPDAKEVEEELEILLQDGRKRHAVDTAQHSEFSTSWLYQVKTLWEREAIRHWRDPTYMLAKLALNVVAALFVGFTFFKAKSSIQGTQNKIFVSCLSSPHRRCLAHWRVPTGRLHESSHGSTLSEPDSGRFLQHATRL